MRDRPEVSSEVTGKLKMQAVVGAWIGELLVVLSAWGRWRLVAVLVGLHALRTLLNAMLAAAPAWRWQRRAFFAANTAITLVVVHLAGWTTAAWLVLPFPIIIHDVFEPARYRRWFAYVSLFAAIAHLDGVPGATVAVFSVFYLVLFFVMSARAELLREADRERALMLARLHGQEKLSSLGMMAAGIAHEINNPMSWVTSNLRLLDANLRAIPGVPASVRACVDDVLPDTLDGVGRVNTIVRDLRCFARGDPGQNAEYDLNALVESSLRLARGELVKRGCAVETHLGALPGAHGRPAQLTQVLVNLLVNAADAMPETGGVVRVATSVAGDGVVVSVEDSGAGMTPETQRKLFQPFFTTKPVGQGTGLGLALAYGIVRAHGGQIRVRSEVGRGSTFEVHLPLEAQSAPDATPPLPLPLFADGVRRR